MSNIIDLSNFLIPRDTVLAPSSKKASAVKREESPAPVQPVLTSHQLSGVIIDHDLKDLDSFELLVDSLLTAWYNKDRLASYSALLAMYDVLSNPSTFNNN